MQHPILLTCSPF